MLAYYRTPDISFFTPLHFIPRITYLFYPFIGLKECLEQRSANGGESYTILQCELINAREGVLLSNRTAGSTVHKVLVPY